MLAPIRYSPHARGRKKTNAELQTIVDDLTDEAREALAMREARFQDVCNLLLLPSIHPGHKAGPRSLYMFDELVVDVAKAIGSNTGTKPHRLHTANPDANWWGKGDKQGDLPRWRFGVTFVMATDLPDTKCMPTQVLSMHFGKATGGATEPAVHAIRAGKELGSIPPRAINERTPLPWAVADRGFTNKDGLADGLLREQMYLVQDYPKSGGVQFPIPLDRGPVLWYGNIVCPGFAKVARNAKLATGEDNNAAQQDSQERILNRVRPGFMAINDAPTIRSAQRGRPSKKRPARQVASMQVICPARAGKCRCPLFADAGQSKELPAVPDAPDTNHRPDVCTKSVTSINIELSHFKWWQRLEYGSTQHRRLFEYARSRNEGWHSPLRKRHTGGIEGFVYNTLGAERVGMFVALAAAWTNRQMWAAFERKNS